MFVYYFIAADQDAINGSSQKCIINTLKCLTRCISFVTANQVISNCNEKKKKCILITLLQNN